MMRVVALADTHAPRRWKSCPPLVAEHLRRADLILHAGDVCTATVLDELSQYAPVLAVVGNNDGPDVAAWGAQPTLQADLDGLPVAMIHDSGSRSGPAAAAAAHVPRRRPGRVRALAYTAGRRGQRAAHLQPGIAHRPPPPAARHVGVLRIESGRLAEARIVPVS